MSPHKHTFPLSAPINPTQMLGGNGGSPFDDTNVWNNRNITAVRLVCGLYVTSIQVRYGDEWGAKHGDMSCSSSLRYYLHTFSPTEYINKIEAWYDQKLDYLKLKTNERTLPACGYKGRYVQNIKGVRLMYISGRASCIVNAIQFHLSLE